MPHRHLSSVAFAPCFFTATRVPSGGAFSKRPNSGGCPKACCHALGCPLRLIMFSVVHAHSSAIGHSLRGIRHATIVACALAFVVRFSRSTLPFCALEFGAVAANLNFTRDWSLFAAATARRKLELGCANSLSTRRRQVT